MVLASSSPIAWFCVAPQGLQAANRAASLGTIAALLVHHSLTHDRRPHRRVRHGEPAPRARPTASPSPGTSSSDSTNKLLEAITAMSRHGLAAMPSRRSSRFSSWEVPRMMRCGQRPTLRLVGERVLPTAV